MTDQNDSGQPARPLTYPDAELAYQGTVRARERFEELTLRGLLAGAAVKLRERGEYDPARHGHRNEEPLTVAEHLEVLATGEVLARYYRHPACLHEALRAGATWEQVADARGAGPATVRQEYREWANGQHRLYQEDSRLGALGLSDAEYAAAMERLGEPGAAAMYAQSHPVLCAHAAQDGAGSHWLEPGEKCSGAWPPEVTTNAEREAGQ